MIHRIKSLALTFSLLVVAASAYSQTIADALRYAVLTPQGSARIAGVGGSFGAMGGDVGVMSINPAGLAGFFKSEFTFTPTITNTNADAFLVDDSANVAGRSKTKFGLSNIGAIFVSRPTDSKWKTSNFTIVYQKSADLNQGFNYRGTTIGSYSESLDEIPPEINNIDYQTASLLKEQSVSQKGSVSELTFGWAGNYDNKLDIGISLGIPFISFEEESVYSERDAIDALQVFNQYDIQTYLDASAAGINYKIGLIYKGLKPIRIGASMHSPNYYTITEDFGSSDKYTFDDGVTDALESDGRFKYKYKTPWKFNGSLGVLYNVGKIKGFVNTDVEFLNYSSSNFDFSAYSNDLADIESGIILNNEVEKELGSVVNFRIGTELAYEKFRLRLGTGLVQSPYSVDDGDYSSSFSFGGGIREDVFYIDLAYTRSHKDEGYIAYTPIEGDNTPLVNTETTKGVFQVTAGFKF